ncbi:MAG: phosphatidylglycerol lysyltransferase domain-containing protein [Treponema sp.]|jgi:hypothetical protein|nr:phosphatidylglycerol lysyltransferase domain-containing protein [Treponema sp.]
MTENTKAFYEYFTGAGFGPVGKDSFPLFQNFRQDSGLIDLSPTLINTWGSSWNSLYKQIAGQLCVVWFCDGNPYHQGLPFYFTVVKAESAGAAELKEAIDTLYELVRNAGVSSLVIESIDTAWLDLFRSAPGYDIQYGYTDDHSEYAYKTADFLELAGTVNKNKRERIGKVLKTPGLSVRDLTRENAGEVLELERRWCEGKDCSVCGSYAGCEKKALETAALLYDESVYKGLLLYSGGEAIGYGIGEKKDRKTAFAYFAKGLRQDYFLYVLYMMTKMYFTDIEYINLGEDMGNPGIRMFKSHVGRFEYWRKYHCSYSKPFSAPVGFENGPALS